MLHTCFVKCGYFYKTKDWRTITLRSAGLAEVSLGFHCKAQALRVQVFGFCRKARVLRRPALDFTVFDKFFLFSVKKLHGTIPFT